MITTNPQIPGMHHATAIAGDPQHNLDFYTGVLGLRLVKLTVNFDDPSTYHFYYGDGLGNPGTILTFFPFIGSPQGRLGTGQTNALAFAIPSGSADYWQDWLAQHRVKTSSSVPRFDDQVISFSDPDGLPLELVTSPERDHAQTSQITNVTNITWAGNPIPAEHAIRGIDHVTLSVTGMKTAALLTDTLGFRPVGDDQGRFRYAVADGGSGARIDVLPQVSAQRGLVAVGSVHHIAWRTPDDAEQITWYEKLSALHYNVTPVQDRQYFHSIYFREPGGVLFEIATDPPGFATDETPEQLGSTLKLPAWLEPQRAEITRLLPPIRLPG